MRLAPATTTLFRAQAPPLSVLARILLWLGSTMVAPHDRLLHDLVLRSMPTLVDLAEERGGFVPRHVVRYLDRFGHCGEPEQGFALLRCSCGAAKVVPFRCHGRALCPTCGGRAMASGAAHLVDSVLSYVTVRQWVLSVL